MIFKSEKRKEEHPTGCAACIPVFPDGLVQFQMFLGRSPDALMQISGWHDAGFLYDEGPQRVRCPSRMCKI